MSAIDPQRNPKSALYGALNGTGVGVLGGPALRSSIDGVWVRVDRLTGAALQAAQDAGFSVDVIDPNHEGGLVVIFEVVDDE